MRVKVRLHGILRDKLPPEAKGVTLLEVAEGTAVSHIISLLNINSHIQAAVNDEIVDDWQTPLHDGDTVEVFRPAAGGSSQSIGID